MRPKRNDDFSTMIAKVETRGAKGFAGFAKLDAYIERFEAANVVRRSANLDPVRPVPEQMDEAARLGTGRVRNPAYHYVLSWDHDRVPQSRIWEAVEKSLEALGCAAHQWVAAQHIDTDHTHVHVLVNRIDPITHLAWRPRFDYVALQRLCQSLEPRAIDDSRSMPSPRAADHESWSGQQSMQTWARASMLPEILSSLEGRRPTWKSLHAILAQHGATYDIGSGAAVIRDQSARRRRSVKAGAVDPQLKHENLERLLGPYQPAPFYIVPNKERGYGARLARWDLPTAAMAHPLVRPLYDRYVYEQIIWQTTGRQQAKEERRRVRILAREERALRTADAAAAFKLIDSSLAGEARLAARYILREVIAFDEADIRERERERRITVSATRPHELFRHWLKERAADDDAAARVAIAHLRKCSMTDKRPSPLIPERRSDTLGAAMDDASKAPSALNDQLIATRLAAAIAQVRTHDGYSDETLAIAELAHAQLKDSPVFQSLEHEIFHDPALLNADRQLMLHAVLAVSGVDTLAESDIRALYGPLEQHAAYADFGPAFAAKLDMSEIDQLSRAAETPTASEPAPNLESGSVVSGDFARRLADPDERFAPSVEAEDEMARHRAMYANYLDGVGNGLFVAQTALYEERRRSIAKEYETRKAAARGLPGPEATQARSKAVAWRLRTEAHLNRAYRIEELVLEDCSGIEAPRSLRQFLTDLGTPESLKLAEACTETEAPSVSRNRPKFADTSTLATKLTWSDLEGGNVEYKIEGRHAFVDEGDTIQVRSSRDKEAAQASLLMAGAKFNNVIQLNGSASYKRLMLRQAVQMGVFVSNPELRDLQKAYAAEEAAKAANQSTHQAAKENVDKDGVADTRLQIETLFKDASLSEQQRNTRLDEIIQSAAAEHIKDNYRQDVLVAKGPILDGALKDVIVFSRRAYAILAEDTRGASGPAVMVPITKQASNDVAFAIGSDVRVQRSAIGSTYDVDTEHVRQINRGRGR